MFQAYQRVEHDELHTGSKGNEMNRNRLGVIQLGVNGSKWRRGLGVKKKWGFFLDVREQSYLRQSESVDDTKHTSV